jgi:hypothetical protein
MSMTKLDARETTRTLTVVLPEAQWHALRSVEPDAIGWLQERIRERIVSSGAAEERGDSASDGSGQGSFSGADER